MKNKVYDIIIIGFGPAGIGFINSINQNSNLKIGLIESGGGMNDRNCKVLHNEQCLNCPINKCEMLHGIGGASLLGGHKISTFPAGTFLNNILLKEEQDIEYYSDLLKKLASILQLKFPNINVDDIDKAREFYSENGYEFKYYDSLLCSLNDLKNGYEILLKKNLKNVDVLLNTTVKNIEINDSIYELTINNKREKIETKKVVVAAGRSGISLLSRVSNTLNLKGEPNHLELGIRLEFPTNIFESIDEYHKDLKLLRNNIRTFCVSKNGMLSPYYCNGMYIVDGFFDVNKPTKYTNLALMLRLKKDSSNATLFESIKCNMKNRYNLKPIIQDFENFVSGSSKCNSNYDSSISFIQPGSIHEIYPKEVCDLLVASTKYFASTFFNENDFNMIKIIAPSIEYFWMDFPLEDDFSITDNFYLIGDCSGKYRGILQAFVSGAILGHKMTN